MKLLKILSIFTLVLMVLSCNMFLNQEGLTENNGNLSKILVTIGSNGRTILPEIEGFNKFILSAKPASGNSNSAPSNVEIEEGNYSGEIFLPFGNWDITVTAYIDHNGEDIPVVSGTLSLNVKGILYYINIPVIVPTAGGKGNFEYTIDFPDDADVVLKLVKWPINPSDTPVINDNTIESGDPVTREIDSGIYFLTLTANLDGKTITKNQVAHIYDKSTSSVSYNITKSDFASKLVRLGGTVNITVDGKPVQGISMGVNIDTDEGNSLYFYIGDINDNTKAWQAEIPPVDNGKVSLFIDFYDSDWRHYFKKYSFDDPMTEDMSDIAVTYNIQLTKLSGYADLNFWDGLEYANVVMRRTDGDYIAETHYAIDRETFSWELSFEALTESTDVYFVVEYVENGEWYYNYYYNEDVNFTVGAGVLSIQNINLSYGRIYLSGTVNVTVTGQGQVGQTFLDIGTAETGLNSFNVDQIYYWEPESLNFNWVTWVNSKVDNSEGSGEIDVLNKTLYFKYSVSVPAGKGSVSTSVLIDKTVVTGINLTGAITSFTP